MAYSNKYKFIGYTEISLKEWEPGLAPINSKVTLSAT